MKRRVAFQTLGCRLNQYETDSLVTDFRRGGYEIVPFDDEADCYIVNTCTVTDRSDRKSRNLIRRSLRHTGSPIVVVTGCYVESSRAFVESLPGVTYAIGNGEKYRIFDLVDAHFNNEIDGRIAGGPGDSEVPDVPSADAAPLADAAHPEDRFAFGDALEGFHTRATLKIQDGCDNFCTFCIIPFVRGRAVSRSAVEVEEHARRVIDAGAKEIVLTGVNMGRYHDGETSFVSLIERLLELPGEYRLRLSSMEPDIQGEGFENLVDHERFCPHLHLCIQSGSDRVLQAMGRQYSVADYLGMVETIRRHNADFNFTTDVLVGFPGESGEDFAETIRTIRTVGFSHIHTFPYSLRSGTKAEKMPGQLDERVKSARAAEVRSVSEELKRAYRLRFTGRKQRLLVESVSPGLSGYSEYYLPVHIPPSAGETGTKNRFVDVRISGVAEGDDPVLVGDLIDPSSAGRLRNDE